MLIRNKLTLFVITVFFFLGISGNILLNAQEDEETETTKVETVKKTPKPAADEEEAVVEKPAKKVKKAPKPAVDEEESDEEEAVVEKPAKKVKKVSKPVADEEESDEEEAVVEKPAKKVKKVSKPAADEEELDEEEAVVEKPAKKVKKVSKPAADEEELDEEEAVVEKPAKKVKKVSKPAADEEELDEEEAVIEKPAKKVKKDPKQETADEEFDSSNAGPILELDGEGGQIDQSITDDSDIIIEEEMIKTPDTKQDSSTSAKKKKLVKKTKEKKEAFGKLETFEEELGWDYWFGSGNDSRFKHERTKKDSYAGKYSLYMEYEVGLNSAENWIQAVRNFSKPYNMSGNRSLVFWLKSSGKGGTLSVTLTSAGKSYVFMDHFVLYNPNGWVKVTVPLTAAMNEIDLSAVMGYSIAFHAGIPVSALKEQKTAGLIYPIKSIPFRNFLYIDEVSLEKGGNNSIDPGKMTVDYSGSLNVAYNNNEYTEPNMTSQLAVDIALNAEKYAINANLSVPVSFPAEYLPGTYGDEVRMQTYDFTSKQWDWNYARPIYVYSLNASLNKLKPFIDSIMFGNLSLDYDTLAVGAVYNQNGVNAKGTFPDAFKYSTFYASQKSGGYSIGGMVSPLLTQKIPGLEITTVFLNDTRKGRIVSEDNTFQSRVYKNFQNYGIHGVERIKNSKKNKKIDEIVLEAAYYLSSEDNMGTALLSPDYSREENFVPGYVYQGKTNDRLLTEDNAYRFALVFNGIGGLNLNQKFEFRKIGANYMGVDTNTLAWLPFLEYNVGNKLHAEVQENSDILIKSYWRDQFGAFSETKFTIQNLDLSCRFDYGRQDSRPEYRFKNISASAGYGLYKFYLSYDFDLRNFENINFTPENEKGLAHELGLHFMLDNNTLIKTAYGLFDYTENDSVVYDNQTFYVYFSHRILANIVLSGVAKNVIANAQESVPSMILTGKENYLKGSIETYSYYNLFLTIAF